MDRDVMDDLRNLFPDDYGDEDIEEAIGKLIFGIKI